MKYLACLLSIAALFCGFLSPAPAVAQLLPTLPRPGQEIKIFNQINQIRAAYLLPPLTWNPLVAQLARNHSTKMANGSKPFGHQGAAGRFSIIQMFIPNAVGFGENVAYNVGMSDPASTAVNGWRNSPGHFGNIIGDFNLTGVGAVSNSRGEFYYTQIFVKTDSQFSALEDPEELEADVLQRQPFQSLSENPPANWDRDSFGTDTYLFDN